MTVQPRQTRVCSSIGIILFVTILSPSASDEKGTSSISAPYRASQLLTAPEPSTTASGWLKSVRESRMMGEEALKRARTDFDRQSARHEIAHFLIREAAFEKDTAKYERAKALWRENLAEVQKGGPGSPKFGASYTYLAWLARAQLWEFLDFSTSQTFMRDRAEVLKALQEAKTQIPPSNENYKNVLRDVDFMTSLSSLGQLEKYRQEQELRKLRAQKVRPRVGGSAATTSSLVPGCACGCSTSSVKFSSSPAVSALTTQPTSCPCGCSSTAADSKRAPPSPEKTTLAPSSVLTSRLTASSTAVEWPLRHPPKVRDLATSRHVNLDRYDSDIAREPDFAKTRYAYHELYWFYGAWVRDDKATRAIDEHFLNYVERFVEANKDTANLPLLREAKGEWLATLKRLGRWSLWRRFVKEWGLDDFDVYQKYFPSPNPHTEYKGYLICLMDLPDYRAYNPDAIIGHFQRVIAETQTWDSKYDWARTLAQAEREKIARFAELLRFQAQKNIAAAYYGKKDYAKLQECYDQARETLLRCPVSAALPSDTKARMLEDLDRWFKQRLSEAAKDPPKLAPVQKSGAASALDTVPITATALTRNPDSASSGTCSTSSCACGCSATTGTATAAPCCKP